MICLRLDRLQKQKPFPSNYFHCFLLYGNEIPERWKCSKLWNFKNFVIELWKRLRLNHHPESNQTRIEAEKWNYRKHPFHYQDKTSWNIFRKSNNFWKMIPNLKKFWDYLPLGYWVNSESFFGILRRMFLRYRLFINLLWSMEQRYFDYRGASTRWL